MGQQGFAEPRHGALRAVEAVVVLDHRDQRLIDLGQQPGDGLVVGVQALEHGTQRLVGGFEIREELLVLEPASAGRVLATFDSAVRLTTVATPIGGHHQRVVAVYDARHYRGPQAAS